MEILLFIRFIASIMPCYTALCCRRDKTSYPLENREQFRNSFAISTAVNK
jgi:hypothetical protein